MESATEVLQVTNLSKSYGGLKAMDSVSFSVKRGEIMALVGDNGAGKSTLVKALSGAQPPDSGQIVSNGQRVDLRSPRDADAAGIGCIHQSLGLVDALNVPENVFLGRELQRKRFGFLPELDHASMRAKTVELLDRFGVHLATLNSPVVKLSGGQRQSIAISRLLLQDVRLVIMDEPMAALGLDEGKRVMELVCNMRDQGISIFIISHNLEHVFQIADRIAVLKNGRLVDVVETAATSREAVIKMVTFGSAH
ncbi:MAG: ATP-binding cassette domain-containing protein [Granulosicoccus sp.]